MQSVAPYNPEERAVVWAALQDKLWHTFYTEGRHFGGTVPQEIQLLEESTEAGEAFLLACKEHRSTGCDRIHVFRTGRNGNHEYFVAAENSRCAEGPQLFGYTQNLRTPLGHRLLECARARAEEPWSLRHAAWETFVNGVACAGSVIALVLVAYFGLIGTGAEDLILLAGGATLAGTVYFFYHTARRRYRMERRQVLVAYHKQQKLRSGEPDSLQMA